VLNNKAEKVSQFLARKKQSIDQQNSDRKKTTQTLITMEPSDYTLKPVDHVLPLVSQFTQIIDLPYSGLTKEQILDMSVDDLFRKMNKNLNKRTNKDFEQKCQVLFSQNYPQPPVNKIQRTNQ
jgi:hypothetical protein